MADYEKNLDSLICLLPYPLHKCQIELLNEIKRGGDVIGILGTGWGKTLVFVLSALAWGGVTEVITPLVALRADQETHSHLLICSAS